MKVLSNGYSARVNKVFGLAMYLCAFALLVFVHNANADSYKDQTQRTINQLSQSMEWLKKGNTEASKAALVNSAASIKELQTAGLNYRELANREHGRCMDRVGELELRIGSLYQEQQELDKKIGDLDAQLVNAAKDKQITQAEINSINTAIAATQASLRERARKLEELKKWWWVPGYGLYLGIRTLADNDIGAVNSLINTLNDKNKQMQHQQNTLRAVQELIPKLSQERDNLKQTVTALSNMREEVRKRLSELKAMAVFLVQSEVFWGKLDGLFTITVKGYQDDLELLYNMLNSEQNALPLFTDEITSSTRTLKEALVEFSDSLDTGKNFLLEKSTDYCGGPERQQGNAITVSQKCNVQSITQYFEIVDPEKCSFRYLNPPGCPPASKNIVVNAETISKGYLRSSVWTFSYDQNWIGQNRCSSPDAIYYGVKNNIDECAQTCMADPMCSFWTFNRENGYMPRSIHECWGAKATLLPQKSNWGGFTSGGQENVGLSGGGVNAPLVSQAPSSYQQSCRDIKVFGARLTAQCATKQGSLNNTSILIKGISNNDGTLQFIGINIESNYQYNCENINVSGATLMAQCKTKEGIKKNASILIPGIHNNDGNLTY